MAEPQSTAPSRASSEPPTAGVIHVRRRLTANFTILSNRLAQRPGSAVTVGVGAYLMSVPDGVPVSIDALRSHFSEGRDKLSRALNELEAEGFLERVVVRTDNGQIRTRTYVYNSPGAEAEPEPQPERAPAPEPSRPASVPAAQVAPPPVLDATPEAAAVLRALRTRDPRLLLSARAVARLAPAVEEWRKLGVAPDRILDAVCHDLPAGILRSPAGLVAYRLAHLKPVEAVPLARAPIVPMQTCEQCDRAYRAEHPGKCQGCAPAPATLAAA